MADITKASTDIEVVFLANTVAGEAYIGGSRATYSLPDDAAQAVAFNDGAKDEGLTVEKF